MKRIERKTMLKLIVKEALKEDIGNGDITTNSLIPKEKKIKARIFSRENAVVCGVEIAKEVFRLLDPQVKLKVYHSDASIVKAGETIIEISGKARGVLSGERVALNFLSHLSGIASATARFVALARPSGARILDTRKTLPGMRSLEKYAVICGGGFNYRQGLGDAVLIKDNHKIILREKHKLCDLIKTARLKNKNKKVEIEVEDLKELKEALKARPDIIMLDNLSLSQIKKAVRLVKSVHKKKPPLLEASGNISLKNVCKIAGAGVDFISVGELTHSARAIDMSLEII